MGKKIVDYFLNIQRIFMWLQISCLRKRILKCFMLRAVVFYMYLTSSKDFLSLLEGVWKSTGLQ